MFMMFNKLPEKKSQFQNIRKLQNLVHFNEQNISCIEIFVVSNFDFLKKKMLRKDGPLAIKFTGRWTGYILWKCLWENTICFFKDCLPYLFHGFRNKYLNKISLDSMLYFQNKLHKFEKLHFFFDKYAMKNNLQNKM